jgi:hypothetical protein
MMPSRHNAGQIVARLTRGSLARLTLVVRRGHLRHLGEVAALNRACGQKHNVVDD